MDNGTWKIGEIAKRTGITVRTLHHYDEIGLFSPSRTTESGHRLYSDEDLAKLHPILSLRQLGFSLDEIKVMLNNPDFSVSNTLRLLLDRIDVQIVEMNELRSRLMDIDQLLATENAATGENLYIAAQMIGMMKHSHFTTEQLEEIRRRFRKEDAEGIVSRYAEGTRLLEEFRRNMNAGNAPGDLQVAELARKWDQEIKAYAPDESFVQSAEHYYGDHPDEAAKHGMDKSLYAYIKEAVKLAQL